MFDFDGTLTKRDTLIEYLKFARGSINFYFGFLYLSPVLLFWRLGIIKNWRAKEMVLTYFIGGVSERSFEESCIKFVQVRLPHLVRKRALERLNFHKLLGDEIYIVSASPEGWVRLYAESIGVKCIATRLEIINERLTGKIQGKNCYGSEKVYRIQELVEIKSFTSISSYGDSSGDREMLELADNKYYRIF